MTNYIAEAIEEAWGERCSEINPDCHCCRAWKQYEDLVASLTETLAVATRNEEGEFADRARAILARQQQTAEEAA